MKKILFIILCWFLFCGTLSAPPVDRNLSVQIRNYLYELYDYVKGLPTSTGAGTGTMTTIKEANSAVGDADIVTLDFGSGFDLTETPDTEINIALDLSEYSGYNNTNWDTAYGWGNHASANYFDIDTDTLDDVPDGTTYKLLTATKDGYIDQDVGSGSSPTLDGTNFTGIPAGAYVAASIDGDDINSNIAGRSLTLTGASPDTLDADAELYTDWKGITIETPTDADNFFVFEAPIALTITRVTGIVESATSAVLTWQECDSAGDNCSTIEAVTADVDGTIVTSGDIDNASIDAGDIIRLDVGTVTGTVGQAHSTITFTKND